MLLVVLNFITIALLGSVLVAALSSKADIQEVREFNEEVYARQEMLERTVGIDENSQRLLVQLLMHGARTKTGMAIVIEGKTPLNRIKDTGDTSGVLDINLPILKTLVESEHTSKGAILIRRNKIVAFNTRMGGKIESEKERRDLMALGLGKRHVGAYSVVRNNPGTVSLVVSGETGKISMFGHLMGELSADVALELKEFSIRGGVGQAELEYRLNDLLVGQGIDASLESVEVAEDIALSKESREERKARRKKEKEIKKIKRREQKERDQEEKRLKREQERAEKEGRDRGKFYKSGGKG